MMRPSTAASPLVAVLLAVAAAGQEPAPVSRPVVLLARPPASPDPAAHYLFYLHGQIIEDQGVRPTHPRFGIYEYRQILDTLAARGLVVMSEARPSGSQVAAYADAVAAQVRQLLAAGVPPEHVAVAGHSKGGIIAAHVSGLVGETRIRYVLIACCGVWIEAPDAPRLSGRVLSIREASDELAGPCQPAFTRARKGTVSREVVLHLGGGHGAFYRPQPGWIDPLLEWVTRAP